MVCVNDRPLRERKRWKSLKVDTPFCAPGRGPGYEATSSSRASPDSRACLHKCSCSYCTEYNTFFLYTGTEQMNEGDSGRGH